MDEVRVVKASAKPLYRLIKPFYIDDNYIAEGVEIEFTGIPNEQMEPLNAEAEARMTEFLKANGGFTPRIEDIVYQRVSERPQEVSMPRMEHNIPQMPGVQISGQPAIKPAPAQATITKVPTAEVRTKKLMGTVVQETPSPGEGSI